MYAGSVLREIRWLSDYICSSFEESSTQSRGKMLRDLYLCCFCGQFLEHGACVKRIRDARDFSRPTLVQAWGSL